MKSKSNLFLNHSQQANSPVRSAKSSLLTELRQALHPCLCLGALTSVCGMTSASAVTIFESDFDSVPLGALTNNQTIASDLVARIATDLTITSVASGGGNALQFTDNNPTFLSSGSPLLKSTNFGAVSTTGTGNNLLSGTFDITRLDTGVPMQFYIQSGTGESTGSSLMIARIEFNSNGTVNYYAGNAATSTGVPLELGTAYRFTYSVDLSSDTQDKWSLSYATVADPGVSLFSALSANTWQPNLTPGIAVFRGGSNSTNANAAPTWQLDNVSLTANPASVFDPYQSWAQDKGLTVGVNDAHDDDPDLDGVENLIEYILGGDPLLTSDANLLPQASINGTDLEFIFARQDSSEAGTTLIIQHGDNLTDDWVNIPIGATGSTEGPYTITVEENSENADTIKVSVPASTYSRHFFRLKANRP